eukprot:m.183945 g.183945  ORF g.183945 m.183945 type:complete len:655 (+) comp14705_c0_seq3:47-2011(+)
MPRPVRRVSSSDVSDDVRAPPPLPAAAAFVAPPTPPRRSLPVASVVKIFTITSKPNYMQPWQMGRQEACTGSGFIIVGKRILTNAHVVSDYTSVRVRKHGDSHKWQAKVLCINEMCDLALLTVESPGFWKNLPHLDVAPEVPNLDERVLVIGYPMGGDNICVTRGVVSRVTTLTYNSTKVVLDSSTQLLAVQIDAAINSGNSGGPVFRENGTVVGVAFSGYAGMADNIGYIIPYPVINNFLSAIASTGASTRVCDLGFSFELCENKSMQRMLKLQKGQTGIRVIKMKPLGATKGILKAGDVVMEINGYKIANDGTIEFRQDERVSVHHAITSNPIGTSLPIKVLRRGVAHSLTAIGAHTPSLLKDTREFREMPSYLIVCGAVFTPLTTGLLEAAVDDFDDDSWECARRPKKYVDQEVVVIIAFLADPVNHGYNLPRIVRVAKCNGVKVRNLKHLKVLIDRSDEFIKLILSTGRTIVFEKSKHTESEKDILETYAVPSACSKDLLELDPAYEPVEVDSDSDSDTDSDADSDSDAAKKKKTKKTKKQKKKASGKGDMETSASAEEATTDTTTDPTTQGAEGTQSTTSPVSTRATPKRSAKRKQGTPTRTVAKPAEVTQKKAKGQEDESMETEQDTAESAQAEDQDTPRRSGRHKAQ